ncbi:TonB-dependent receptor [Persicobacter sp. CCB-QB2]|uniref:TonB-dependent receptor domain-containing protein n=1 Tax=Persicobacter sp. CCB-QB2 TaxID=1561025 RepID=UPI0006A9AF7F|nr:TonB-dependent receptor [Persicobacter sp. CCB-QB2]
MRLFIAFLFLLSFIFLGLTPTSGQDSLRTVELKQVIIREGRAIKPKISLSAGNSLDQALESNGAVQLQRKGVFGADPVINGLSGHRISMSLDGIRVFGACADRMDPMTNYLGMASIAGMEVMEGMGSALEGNNIGGHINFSVFNLADLPRSWSGNVGLLAQSNGFGGAMNMALAYKGEHWGFRYTAEAQSADSYRSGGGERVDFSYYRKMNHHLALEKNMGNHHFRLNMLWDQAHDIGYPALPMDTGFSEAYIFWLTHHFVFSDNISVENKLYYSQIYHEMSDEERIDKLVDMDMPNWSRSSGGYSRWKYHQGRLATEVKGEYYQYYSFSEMKMYPEDFIASYMQTLPEVKRSVFALSAVLDYRLGLNYWLVLNGRGEFLVDELLDERGIAQWRVLGYDLSSPRNFEVYNANVRIGRRIGEASTIDFGLGFGKRASSLSELYAYYLFNTFDGYDYRGNPDLEGESAIQWQLNYQYQQGSHSVSLDVFSHYFFNFIMGEVDPALIRMTPEANGVKAFGDKQAAIISGLNFQYIYEKDSWNFSLPIHYQLGQRANGEPLPLMLPLSVRPKIQKQMQNLSFEMEYEAALRQFRISKSFGEQSTKAYHLVHLGLQWEKANWKIKGQIQNVMDQAYRTHLDWGGILRPGRNFVLGLSYGF